MSRFLELEQAVNELLNMPTVAGEITVTFEHAREENGGSLHAAQLYQVFADGVRRIIKKLEPVHTMLFLPEDRNAYERTLLGMKTGECARTPFGTMVECVPNGWLYQMRGSNRAVFVPKEYRPFRKASEPQREVVPQ